MGLNCSYVACNDTKEELMNNAGKHGMEVHGYTEEQLNDPEMMKTINGLIKEEGSCECK